MLYTVACGDIKVRVSLLERKNVTAKLTVEVAGDVTVTKKKNTEEQVVLLGRILCDVMRADECMCQRVQGETLTMGNDPSCKRKKKLHFPHIQCYNCVHFQVVYSMFLSSYLLFLILFINPEDQCNAFGCSFKCAYI